MNQIKPTKEPTKEPSYILLDQVVDGKILVTKTSKLPNGTMDEVKYYEEIDIAQLPDDIDEYENSK